MKATFDLTAKRSGLKKITLALVLAGCLGGVVIAPVQAGGAIVGATEITQLLNNIELIDVALTEAANLAKTIEQYQLMLQEFEKLPNFIRGHMASDLQALAQLVEFNDAVSYANANVGDRYNQAFWDTDKYAAWYKTASADEKSTRWQEIARSNHDAIVGALKSANLQQDMFDGETENLDKIMEQLSTAKGANQIMQAAASIAALQVEQGQKMRQLQMASMQVQASQAAAAADRQAAEAAAMERSKEFSFRGQPPSTIEPLSDFFKF